MGIRRRIGEKVVDVGEAIKPADTPPPVTSPKAPWWVVLLTFVGAAALLIAGALVLREGREIWVDPDPPVVSQVPTKESTKVVKRFPRVKKRAKNRTRPRITARERTVERASQDGSRSEGLAIATLATGAALLLAGGFAARLTSIKLPGGVEMVAAAAYNAGAEAGATSTAKAAVVARDEGKAEVLADEKKLAEAGQKALHARIQASDVPGAIAAVASGGVPALGAIDDERLEEAAKAAVEEVAE